MSDIVDTDIQKHEELLKEFIAKNNNIKVEITEDIKALMSYMYILGWTDGIKEGTCNYDQSYFGNLNINMNLINDNIYDMELSDTIQSIINSAFKYQLEAAI